MQRRDIVINAVLVVIIVVLCYLVAVSTYEEPRPGKGIVPIEKPATPRVNEGETEYNVAEGKYANFGRDDIFRTIIPRPTPVPTQAPTPRPTPSLERATHYWRLISASGNEAIIEDTKLHTEYTLHLNETMTIPYLNDNLDITLIEVNENNYSVTIRYQDQTKTLNMF
jgi:hypothetical protein